MILTYFTYNFMMLMILSALIVMMWVNRREKIPASKLFVLVIIILIIISIMDAVSLWTQQPETQSTINLSTLLTVRTFVDATSYIVRPVIIMIEVFIIIPGSKYRLLCLLPAVLNGIIFATAYFGSEIAFYIDENNRWHPGPLRRSIFISQFVYLILLLVFSVIYFKRNNLNRSVIVMVIFVQSIVVMGIEITYTVPGSSNPVTALCMLEYYIYLSTIYQHEMKETIARKELEAAKSELMTLRNQIHPHFIYNSLSIIRSLAKRDSEMAVSCIDRFSAYLKSHIGAMQKSDMIPFEEELKCVKVYISLVQVDYTRKVDVKYDLAVTDFYLPPLSLEPIVENAIDHGLGIEGGTVSIQTAERDGNVVISISDNGTASGDKDDCRNIRNGVGLANTRRRLEIQCDGTLDINITDSGTTVEIVIPRNKGGNL